MIKSEKKIIRGKEFILNQFPAVDGFEILTTLGLSVIPKLGDIKISHETCLKIMQHVGIQGSRDIEIKLVTKELVDAHCSDWEVYRDVLREMLRFNCSFFQSETILSFYKDTSQKVQGWITETLTHVSQLLSKLEKPSSTS